MLLEARHATICYWNWNRYTLVIVLRGCFDILVRIAPVWNSDHPYPEKWFGFPFSHWLPGWSSRCPEVLCLIRKHHLAVSSNLGMGSLALRPGVILTLLNPLSIVLRALCSLLMDKFFWEGTEYRLVFLIIRLVDHGQCSYLAWVWYQKDSTMISFEVMGDLTLRGDLFCIVLLWTAGA